MSAIALLLGIMQAPMPESPSCWAPCLSRPRAGQDLNDLHDLKIRELRHRALTEHLGPGENALLNHLRLGVYLRHPYEDKAAVACRRVGP